MNHRRNITLTISVVVGILFFFFIVGAIKIVSPTEVAVAERFGQVIGQREPGIHFDLFSTYTRYDTRIQTAKSTQAAATDDLQDINVDVTVNYRLRRDNISDIYQQIGGQLDIQSKALDPLTAQVVKQVATKYGGEELIRAREEVSATIQDQLTTLLGDDYYIDVEEVSLTNLTFTNADFNAAIDRKQIAEQKALEAEFDLERVKLEAEQQRVQQETLTEEILRKQWIEKWNGVLPTTLVTDEESQILLPTSQ